MIENLVIDRALARLAELWPDATPGAKLAVAYWLACIAGRCSAAGLSSFDSQIQRLYSTVTTWAKSAGEEPDFEQVNGYVLEVGRYIGLVGVAEELGGES